MTEAATAVDNAPNQEKRKDGAHVIPPVEAVSKPGSELVTSESEMMYSPSKRKCMNPKMQPSGDPILNEEHQPGSNLSFNVNNFVSEIKITVSDYISQQYLVRGSPNYKVLKDKIREYCLSMKPTGMKDDASCSVLYLVYKSLPELKRTDEADSIIRKMIGKHIRNAKYRAKCKLRECKMTEAEKGTTIPHKNEAQDKANYSTEALLHPSLLVMLRSEAYKMQEPHRNEILQASVRDCQMNIRSNLANAIKTQPPPVSAEDLRKVSYGVHSSLSAFNSNNKQPAFSNVISSSVSATSSLDVSGGLVSNGWVANDSGSEQSLSTPVNEVQVKKEVSPSRNQDSIFSGGFTKNRSSVDLPVCPEPVKPRLLISATRRAEQSPKPAPPPLSSPAPPPLSSLAPPHTSSVPRQTQLNEVCEHRLKFITGLTYACFLCNDYFERVPAERLICQHCKKVFSHRHLLLQHNNEAHAYVNSASR